MLELLRNLEKRRKKVGETIENAKKNFNLVIKAKITNTLTCKNYTQTSKEDSNLKKLFTIIIKIKATI